MTKDVFAPPLNGRWIAYQSGLARTMQEAISDGTDDEIVEAIHTYLGSYGSNERSELLARIGNLVSPPVFWRTLHAQWSGFDRVPHRQYSSLFRRHRPHWRADYMNDEGQRAFANLIHGDRRFLTLFRGQDGMAPIGLSWTSDEAVARRFAKGHRGLGNPQPVMVKAAARVADIASIQLNRGEAEFVLFSRSCATSRWIEPIEPAHPYV